MDDSRVKLLQDKFPEIFSSTPRVIRNFEAKVAIKADSLPMYYKARPIPFAIKDAVAEELRRLENNGIVRRVMKSDWATPIVVVPKRGGGLRICGDYKVTVNQVLKTDCYPLPLPEDLYSMLAGGRVFSVLDLSSAYLQVPLCNDAKPLLTVNTHLGLFEYQRLPFGIASAPAIFQAMMDQVLEEECQFFRDSVVYLGHRVSAEGIYPIAEKVKAIRDAPEPTNITAYLGLLNFYAKFLKNLATVAAPLYELLKKDKQWHWTKGCKNAFAKTKEMILSSEVLTFYDVNKPIGLSCGSSAYGLGAVIFHEMPDGSERPIAFASRTLSSSERNYAQGEKEALALIFGLRRFHRYLYGRRFSIYTDHQPLLGLLGHDRPVPSLAAARIQRWAMTLAAYQYHLKYRNGRNMEVADALSRLPLSVQERRDEPDCLAVFDATPLTAAQVAKETKRDPLLSGVVQYALTGWPSRYPQEMQAFFVRRDQLSVEQDCSTWGYRVIIPRSLQPAVLSLLHEAHPGMTRMKMLARSYVWWPGLDKDLESTVRSCKICQSVLPAQTVGPLRPWSYPTRVWQRVHVDYALKDGVNLLVLVDAYSKWVEVFCMNTTTTTSTLKRLDALFASYGYPEELVTDNGPQFASEEFQEFLRQRGIRHTRTPPYHAASNGAAERLVRTTKTALFKEVLEDRIMGAKRTVQERINNFLMSYRNTPNSVTAKAPAELFLKRLPRIRLSLVKPNFASDMADRQKRNTDRRNCERGPADLFSVNDKVFVKTTRGEAESWQEGIIEQVVSTATYLVRVGCHVRFTHADHLRKRRAMAPSTFRAPNQDVAGAASTRPSNEPQTWENVDTAESTSREPGQFQHGSSPSPIQQPGSATSSGDMMDRDKKTPDSSFAEEEASSFSGCQSSTPMLRRSTGVRTAPDRYRPDDYTTKN
ncbi:uncharacterized protein K02A2.6-like [Ornithodoros turicata]|uniref:uncharacterized protein K02A2.6-like n=1 Tax=Ornithodoros turicata TaxID=34597 RepID=UPI003139B321